MQCHKDKGHLYMCQSMLGLNANNIRQKQVTSKCDSKYPANVQNTYPDLEKQQKGRN